MRIHFDLDSWIADMKDGIEKQDAELLAKLMRENDRNGCFSYADVCSECGEMSRDEWSRSTVAYASDMLSRVE